MRATKETLEFRNGVPPYARVGRLGKAARPPGRGPRAERDPPSRLSRVAPWPQLAASLNAAALSPPKHTLVSGGRWLGGHGTREPA